MDQNFPWASNLSQICHELYTQIGAKDEKTAIATNGMQK